MAAKWQVIAGLHDLFGRYADKAPGVAFREGKTLHIKLNDGVTLAAIEREVNQCVSLILPTFNIMRLVALLAVFGLGVLFLLALSVVGVFQEAAASFFLSDDGPTAKFWITTGVCFALGAALLGFLPQALSGPEGSPLRDLVRQWVDHDRRSRRRLAGRLRWGRRLRSFNKVVVWNAARSITGGNGFFLDALKASGASVDFRTHKDEVALFKSRVRQRNWPDVTEADAPDVVGTPSATIDPIEVIDYLLGPRSAESATFLLAFSTVRAVSPWQQVSSAAFNAAIRGSEMLARREWDVRNAENANNALSGVSFETFLNRAENDYGIVTVDRNQHFYEMAAPFDWAAIARDHGGQLAAINNAVSTPVETDLRDLPDPMALFLLMIGQQKSAWTQPQVGNLFRRYFMACEKLGYFPGLPAVAAQLNAEDTDGLPELLDNVPVDGLVALSASLESIGQYKLALKLAKLTAAFEGGTGIVRVARLYERTGQPEKGIDALRRLDEWAANIQHEVVRTGTTHFALSADETQLAVNYFQQRAWIILSGKLNLPDAGPDDAESHLAVSDQLMDSVVAYNPTGIDVWRQQNYEATLLSVRENFDASSERHLDASRLPGVPLRWRYASLINAGTDARRAAISRWLDTEAPDLAAIGTALEQALEWVLSGFRGKLAIGDRDEAPFGANNAALCELYLFQLAERTQHMGPRDARLNAALSYLDQGLGILAETGSIRARAIMREQGRRARAWAAARGLTLTAAPHLDHAESITDEAPLSAADAGIVALLDRLEASLQTR